MITPLRVGVLCCALALTLASSAPAGEVEAELACCHCRHRSCYEPCEPVGPVRRFLRRVFLPPCPRPCPVVVPVPVVQSAPVYVPPAYAPASPPAGLGRPAPVMPQAPQEVPFTGASARPRKLTPPAPPPPIRLDRIASRNGD